jgi:ATP-dependent Clp protease ATP-binding subunit ClpA
MFERFTPYARRVIVLAEQEAGSLRHDRIGTQHLLLGITLLPDIPAARLLAVTGVTREQVTRAIAGQRIPTRSSDPVDALASIGIDVAAIRAAIPAP